MNCAAYSDADSRGKLVQKEYLDKNIFLSAGAGSGKTSSLVKRVIALVLDGREISSIVAITFTREAAKMFYGRITEALEEGAETAPDECARELLREALANIDSAFFGTIDSFCRKMLLEHPSEAGISSDITPMEKSGMLRELAASVLESLVNDREPKDIFEKYKELRNHDISNSQIISIIDHIAQEDIFEIEMGEEPAPFAGDHKERQWLKDAHEIGDILRKEYETAVVAGNSRKASEELTTKDCYAAYLKGVRTLDRRHPVKELHYLEWMTKAWGYKRSKLPKPQMALERAETILASEETADLKKLYEDNKYYKALEFGKLARPLVLSLEKKKGLITYNQSLKALVDLLVRDEKTGGELLSYIRAKYKYYLIDEFQDTNPLQTRLFKYLTDNMPGALFIVGDDKQAIYRFRGGDVDNFKAVEEQFRADDNSASLRLTCNFRSSEALREWFDRKFGENSFFGRDFPSIEQADKQKKFADIQNEVLDGAYEYPVIKKKKGSAGKEGVPGNEHEMVISIIRHLLGKKVSSYDHETKIMTAHSLTYEDMMVITNTKDKLGVYIEAFREAGLPYNVAGSSNLKNSRGLRMLARLLDMMINPDDRFKEAVCLMAEPFSLTAKELYDGTCGKPGGTLTKAKELISAIRIETDQQPPAAIYLHIMERLRITPMLSAFSMGEEPDTLYYGLELVRQATAEGAVADMASLLSFINEELLSGDYEYEMALSGTPKGVRLMNLHKTKGLESKVVILADAEKPADKSGWVDRHYDYERGKVSFFSITGQGYNGSRGAKIVETVQFDHLKILEAEKIREEQIRLKYVAATRAENILIIPRLYKNETIPEELYRGLVPGEQVEGGWDMLLTEDLEVLAPQQQVQEVAISQRYADIADFKPPIWNGESSFITINPSKVSALDGREPVQTKQVLADIHGDPEFDTPLSSENLETGEEEVQWQKDGTLTGTLVHRMMETLVNRIHEEIHPDELLVVLDNILVVNKIPSPNAMPYKSMMLEIAEKMYNGGYCQDHVAGFQNVPEDLMGELRQSAEIHTELPFSIYLKKDDGLLAQLTQELGIEAGKDSYINGVMDLVYRKNDEWYICDYKTNFSADNLLEHYKGQLTLYKAILKMLFDLDREPEAYLYHIPARSKE